MKFEWSVYEELVIESEIVGKIESVAEWSESKWN
jgi:hypothetical protein